MFLLFTISLWVIIYFIWLEFNKPLPPEQLLIGSCPGCSNQVVSGWLVCTNCKTMLRKPCTNCGKVHDAWVVYCPWCRKRNEVGFRQ